jgi:dienelactone hydrolase
MVQIWYPAAGTGPPSPYRLPSETTLRHDRLSLVKTHSAVGVPVSNARPRYPVILYSPSWQGSRNENVAYVEELASHGFVVVGIDHTYGTDVTYLPDGRVIRSNLVNFIDCSSDLAYELTLKGVNSQLQIRVSDVRFVLQEMEWFDKKDPDGLFTGHLDLARVGVFGYSFGGAVAMEACKADSRFRAGVALDSLLFGRSANVGVEQPFLFLTDDSPIPKVADLQVTDGTKRRQALVQLNCVQSMRRSIAEHGGYWIIVRGTKHPNFSDGALFTPLKRRIGVGPIDASQATRMVNQCVLSFFKRFLNDCPSCLLENICARTPELNLVQSASPKGRTNPSHVP